MLAVLRLMNLVGLVLMVQAAHAASSATSVTARGLGPVNFDMTVTQFSRALREPMSQPEDARDRGCFYLASPQFPHVRFMFEDGRLRRIDVNEGSRVTVDGMGINAPVAQLKRRYGKRLADEQDHYGGPEDRYLTLRVPRSMAVRFESSAGRVDNYYIGHWAQVQYVEGCL